MNAISGAKTYKTNRETSEENEWLWPLTSAVFVVYYVMCLTLPHRLGTAGWLRRNLWMEQKLLLSLEATEPGHGKCHGSRVAKGVLGYSSFQAAVWIICLSCTLCYQCCSWYHLLSYHLIAVSNKFFLPQPMIFNFCASFLLSILPQREGEWGRARGSEQAVHGLQCFGGNIKLGNTIPKLQKKDWHAPKKRKGRGSFLAKGIKIFPFLTKGLSDLVGTFS